MWAKKTSVQPTRFPVVCQTDEQSRPRSPENGYHRVVLPLVLFYHAHNTAAAEGIAIAVDETSRSSGILKLPLVTPTAYLRLASGRLRIGIHISANGTSQCSVTSTSELSSTTYSASTCFNARLYPSAKPWFSSCRIKCTEGNSRRSIATEASVEPLSATYTTAPSASENAQQREGRNGAYHIRSNSI